jgi:hypothetical protein
METKSFSINLNNYSQFKIRLESLNKKASKLNLDSIKIENERHFLQKIEIDNKTLYIDKVEITISYKNIKYGEYEFIGTIDHNEGCGNLIKTAPNKIIPNNYFNANSDCDHCNVKRYRTETFIFKDDNGYKQVGRTCLAEFFGIDPLNRLKFYSSINDIGSFDDEYGFNNYKFDFKYETIEVLSVGLSVINEEGYVSKTKSINDGIDSTSSIMLTAYSSFKSDYLKKIFLNKDSFIQKANDIIAWGKEKYNNPTNEYQHNMKVILNSSEIKSNMFGYLISLYPQYIKDLESKEVNNNNNEFIGSINEKITTDIFVSKIIQQNTQFGISYIIRMLEKNTNNTIVWFTSTNKLNEGESYKIMGKVKDHNTWNGINQTILTRCKTL